MRFVADQVIVGLGPEAYESLYFDEPFNEALCAALDMERHLEQRDLAEGTILRRVRIVPRRLIPAPLRRLLGSRRVEYTERAVYTFGAMAGRWTLEPALFADRITGEGTFRFEAHPRGTRRVVEGSLSLSFFGLGGLAERAVVAETERTYEAAARFTSQYVNSTPIWQRP